MQCTDWMHGKEWSAINGLKQRSPYQVVPARVLSAVEGTFEFVRARVTTFANVVVVVFHFGAVVGVDGDGSGMFAAWWSGEDGVRLIRGIISGNVWVSVHVLNVVWCSVNGG